MKVYTTFILSASITRGVTYAKLTHTVAEGRYTTAPYLFPAWGSSLLGLIFARDRQMPSEQRELGIWRSLYLSACR